jgi:hypothetical protein
MKSFTILLIVVVAVPMLAGGKKTAFHTPVISCAPGSTAASINITVTAGASGAPAGYSVQWMLQSELDANGGVWPYDSDVDPNYSSFCKASFSGNASGHNYALSAGRSDTVAVGDVIYDTPGASSACENTPLHCGERYAFRAFAHATSSMNRSAFSNTTTCSTVACTVSGGCTYTQGYWKSHGPIPLGNNTNQWPVTSLSLGGTTYTDLQLLSIFNPPGAGNGLITLSHQLIAAKLNVANGASDTAIAATIAAADALIGGLVVPPVGSGSLSNGSTSALIAALTSYNEGATGPGHCP